MNDSEVSKQVQQMVHFIRQEAEEKANEISVSAEEVRNNLFYNAFLLSAVIRDCFVRAMCVNGCFFSCVISLYVVMIPSTVATVERHASDEI